MSDWRQPLRSTLIGGKSGSGKSTFAYRYLRNVRDVACRFIFDDLGQCHARLGLPQAGTAKEVERALNTKWVVFNPHRMFPGRLNDAFAWFCDWCFEASTRGNGRKIVFVDEIWRFQQRDEIPLELAKLAQMGRAEGIELATATQHVHKVNASITGNLTELVCFKMTDSVDLRKIQQLGADAREVFNLPLGSYVSYNLNTGGILRGKLF